jgi:hypothetical protein
MAMKVSDVYLRYCKFQTLVGGLAGMRTLVNGWHFDWKLWIGVAFKILAEAEKWSSCSKTRVSTSASELDEALKIFNDKAVDVHAWPELIQPILKETGIKIGSQLEIMKQ